MYMFGRNPVLERLERDPGSIKKIFLRKGSGLTDVADRAQERGILCSELENRDFEHRFGGVNTQGLVAEVKGFAYTPFDEIVDMAAEGVSVPLLLDGVTDPHNLGAIIRNVACLGGYSVVIQKRRACEVNGTVLKVASGGENYLPISRVSNFSNSIRKLKKKGVWIAGSVAEGGDDPRSSEIPCPLALIIGSEGAGIRQGLLKELDIKVSLPMYGAPLSYNVAVATTLICYELTCRGRRD